MANFPVDVAQLDVIQSIRLRKEARQIQSFAVSNGGVMNQVSQSAVAFQDFLTRTPATITANQAVLLTTMVVPAGRTYVLTDIHGFVTGNCTIHFTHNHRLDNTINGTTGTISLDGMLDGKVVVVKDTDGGPFSMKLDSPLVLNPGDQLVMYYYRNSTTGVNWMVNYGGMDFTYDTNYTADKTMLVLGDSIGGVTSDAGSLSSGLWPVILRDKYLDQGKDVRLVNISQGGTDSNQWDWWVNQGRIDGLKADILFTNLGMNDLVSTIGITNDTTKSALKNIVKRYLRYNPRGKIVVNSITPSDTTSAVTNGAAYRTEILNAVNEMKALGLPVYLADTSTAYSTSTGAAFVATEQSVGARLHPNTTVGQPAMANIIWEVCKNLI